MRTGILIAAMIAAAPAVAQRPDPVCVRQAVMPGFEAWGRVGDSALAIGREARLPLTTASRVHFEPKLSRRPAAGTFGGFFPVTVERAGTYRIALSDKAWMDVVHRGRKLASTAHKHGAPCTGIAKVVAFKLPAGRSYLQLSGTRARSIGVMVVKG